MGIGGVFPSAAITQHGSGTQAFDIKKTCAGAGGPDAMRVAFAGPEQLPTMEEVERRYVLRVLHSVQGNKALAARILGFDRKTLYRKLKEYGLGEA